jgi:hypothetical protein
MHLCAMRTNIVDMQEQGVRVIKQAGSHQPLQKDTKTRQNPPCSQRPLKDPLQLTESKYSLGTTTGLPITSFS